MTVQSKIIKCISLIFIFRRPSNVIFLLNSILKTLCISIRENILIYSRKTTHTPKCDVFDLIFKFVRTYFSKIAFLNLPKWFLMYNLQCSRTWWVLSCSFWLYFTTIFLQTTQSKTGNEHLVNFVFSVSWRL